ncbi:MAG TPA: Uma2 family endonuclease [Leptospiraceae bacterium]|nr:Uma2 family endonuclease [Leptospiraceae bacterium]HNO26839.1 Uma2 family endonuclease [Leptospiraceae bacterium]
MDNWARKFLTEEEYLNLERNSSSKNEFFRGELFAMAGAKEKHNLIVTNLIRDISTALKKTPCRVYPSDMRVKVSASGLYTYPDISLVCEKPKFTDGRNNTLLNPSVIIEVLAESTESYDRGKKFELYRTLPSLKEYILVSSEQKKLESFLNRADGWMMLESIIGNHFLIRSLNIFLDIEDIARTTRNDIFDLLINQSNG